MGGLRALPTLGATKKTVMIIFAVDIGSELSSKKKENFAWSNSKGDSGKKLQSLLDSMLSFLPDNKISIGFECPLYFDVYDEKVNRQRLIDEGRSWSASAGATSMATGLAQTNFIFRRLKSEFTSLKYRVVTSPKDLKLDYNIFIWEAFITGNAKFRDKKNPNAHIEDCKIAIKEYKRVVKNKKLKEKIYKFECMSLIGAILMRNGCVTNENVLSQRPLVIKPKNKR
jgi:hypothetical protein